MLCTESSRMARAARQMLERREDGIIQRVRVPLATQPVIPAQSLTVSSLDDDSLIGERFARPVGPDAGQIVSHTDTMAHEEEVPCVIWLYGVRDD